MITLTNVNFNWTNGSVELTAKQQEFYAYKIQKYLFNLYGITVNTEVKED